MNTQKSGGADGQLEAPVGPAHRYCLTVPVGGAVHFIPNPAADPHVEWMLRYGRQFGGCDRAAELSAASVIDGFEYLLSAHISMKEATRRLRLLRAARLAALRPNAELTGVAADEVNHG